MKWMKLGLRVVDVPVKLHTVKFLNFLTQENFAVIYLKFKLKLKLKDILSKRCILNSKQ